MKSFPRGLGDIAFFCILLAGLVFSAGGHIAVGDEETMFRVTQNLLAGRGLAVGREDLLVPAQSYPGFLPTQPETFPTTSAVPGRDGKLYSKYGIGASLAAIPLYLLGWAVDGWNASRLPSEGARLSVSMLNPLALAACGWLIVRFSVELGYQKRTGRLLALATLFTTFAWPYVKTFYSQPGATFLTLGTVYCAFRWRRDAQPGFLWWLGLCIAGVILFRVSEAIILPAIILYLIFAVPRDRRWRWVFPVGMGVALALGVTALYNWLRFGSFLSTGYNEVAWDNPVWFGLYGLLISPGKGVLFYAPVLVLSLASLRIFARQHRSESWLIAGLWLSFLIFFAPYKYWTGGWNWGPRFLLPIVPLAVLPVGVFLERKGNRIAWALFGLFCALGFFLQLPAILVDHSRSIYQQVFETHQSNAYTWTIVDPGRSPLRTQWPAALELIGVYRTPQGWRAAEESLQVFSQPATDQVEAEKLLLLKTEFYRRNTLDFWWLHGGWPIPGRLEQVWP